MKKTYLAPMSETLSAILKDICDAPIDPIYGGSSTGSSSGEDIRP